MSILLVTPSSQSPSLGTLSFAGKTYRCALGRSGVMAASEKREGDGATPVGTFALRELWYRADRLERPTCALATRTITPTDGWCDDPRHPFYNKHVQLPFAASHETLWRDDEVYNLIVPLGYNDEFILPGHGSAIFLHVAREGYPPTAGCVALAQSDLLELLVGIGRKAQIIVNPV